MQKKDPTTCNPKGLQVVRRLPEYVFCGSTFHFRRCLTTEPGSELYFRGIRQVLLQKLEYRLCLLIGLCKHSCT